MLAKRFVMLLIKICRKLFYNTPIQRLKITGIVYKKVFHIAYHPGEVISVNYQGAMLSVPTDDITILPGLLNGCYERTELTVLRSVLMDGMTFVDVGANIGLYSVLAGRLVGSSGRVFAFEPEPVNFEFLTQNIRENALSNVWLERAALGSKEGRVVLYKEKGSIGTHSLLARDKSNADLEIDVKMLTLDGYFQNRGGSIDVLKVDVEGYEAFVLQGAKKMLKQVRFLFIEFVGQAQGVVDAGATFEELLSGFPFVYRFSERKRQLYRMYPGDLRGIVYANLLATRSALPCVSV